MQILRTFFISISLLLAVGSASAEQDVDAMLAELEKQLKISKDRYEQLKPELRSALEEKSQTFSNSLDSAREQGLIELEKMGKTYSEASAEASKRLEAFMQGDEVAEFKAYLSGLDEDALREARDQMVEKMIEVLQLTAEQIVAIKPVIEEQMKRLGEILESYLNQGKDQYEQFRVEFEAESRKGIEQVRSILNPQQLETFELQLESIRESIKTGVFDV